MILSVLTSVLIIRIVTSLVNNSTAHPTIAPRVRVNSVNGQLAGKVVKKSRLPTYLEPDEMERLLAVSPPRHRLYFLLCALPAPPPS